MAERDRHNRTRWGCPACGMRVKWFNGDYIDQHQRQWHNAAAQGGHAAQGGQAIGEHGGAAVPGVGRGLAQGRGRGGLAPGVGGQAIGAQGGPAAAGVEGVEGGAGRGRGDPAA